jgi:hypothetical protein
MHVFSQLREMALLCKQSALLLLGVLVPCCCVSDLYVSYMTSQRDWIPSWVALRLVQYQASSRLQADSDSCTPYRYPQQGAAAKASAHGHVEPSVYCADVP